MKKALLPIIIGALAIGAAPARADTFVFLNTSPITVNDGTAGSPYPSQISTSGLVGKVNTATVSLVDVSHGNGRDLDVLLTGPQNQKVLLMSNACQGVALSHMGLAFSPTATGMLPDTIACESGTYLPSAYPGGCDGAGLPSPAPPPPYGSSLSTFTGADPNGAWRLFVVDVCPGDTGTVAGGWSLTLDGPQSTPNPVAKKKCKKKKKGSEEKGSKSAESKKKTDSEEEEVQEKEERHDGEEIGAGIPFTCRYPCRRRGWPLGSRDRTESTRTSNLRSWTR